MFLWTYLYKVLNYVLFAVMHSDYDYSTYVNVIKYSIKAMWLLS